MLHARVHCLVWETGDDGCGQQRDFCSTVSGRSEEAYTKYGIVKLTNGATKLER